MEHFLNKKQKQKNTFDIFFDQKYFKIQKPNNNENELNNKLIFVTHEMKWNQYESFPKVFNDEIKTLDTKIVKISENEKKLPSEQENDHVIMPIKKDKKGLTIDNHHIDIVEDIIDKNDVSNDTLKLKKVVQDTANINSDNKTNNNNKRIKLWHKTNILKKNKSWNKIRNKYKFNV